MNYSPITSEKYHHGGNPAYDFKRLGISERPVIDFSVNVSPLGPPPQVMKAWNSFFQEIKFYPSPNGDGIKQFYKKRFGLEPEYILPGNGSSEVIYLALRVLAPKRTIIVIPSYYDYSRAAFQSGSEIVNIPLKRNDNFTIPDIKTIEENLANADALFVGNPNNPTGTMVSRDFLLQLANCHKSKWIFVDEAFMPFVEDSGQQNIPFTSLPRNVLVFQSLTKFYAVPGLRMGSVIGHPDTISRLHACNVPWSVNCIAEKVAPLLASCKDYENRVRNIVVSERRRMYNRLQSIPGLHVFSSEANYLLAEWKRTDNLDDLMKIVLNEGLYIRDCRNFTGLEKNFFRFSLLTHEKNDRLLSVLIRCTEAINE